MAGAPRRPLVTRASLTNSVSQVRKNVPRHLEHRERVRSAQHAATAAMPTRLPATVPAFRLDSKASRSRNALMYRVDPRAIPRERQNRAASAPRLPPATAAPVGRRQPARWKGTPTPGRLRILAAQVGRAERTAASETREPAVPVGAGIPCSRSHPPHTQTRLLALRSLETWEMPQAAAGLRAARHQSPDPSRPGVASLGARIRRRARWQAGRIQAGPIPTILTCPDPRHCRQMVRSAVVGERLVGQIRRVLPIHCW